MKLAVQDANILIDLEMAGLLDLWFQLDHETHTSDLITAELKKGDHHTALSYADAGVLRVRTFSFEELVAINAMQAECGPGPDLNDCSVLYLADELDAMLLTGDKLLRHEASSRTIEVHGTIWIIDQLVEQELLLPAVAANKLRHLLDSGRRLPREECYRRIRRWSA